MHRFTLLKWQATAASLAAGLAALAVFTGCGGGGSSHSSTTSSAESSPTPSSTTTTSPSPSASASTSASPTPTPSVAVIQSGWTIDTSLATQPTRKWTFLVYLNAANDLEPYATVNMNQMESVGSNSDVNIVVQYKRMGGEYDTTGGTWTDTRRYYVTRGGATLLSQRNNVDMGSSSTLKDFVSWATQAYPAQHYAVVMWSHGSGWRAEPTKRGSIVRGISYDDSTGNNIKVTQLASALSPLSSWDIVSFDACLMQMPEVAYELKNTAQYIVGSEGDTPADGYPYNTILADLEMNSSWGALQFGTAMASDTVRYYNNTENDTTQSVLDTSKLAALASACNTLGSTLLSKTQGSSTYATQIANIRSHTHNYDTDYYPDFRDLYTFARLIAAPTSSDISYSYSITKDSATVSAAQSVMSAVQSLVVASYVGSLYSGSGGLGAYLPTPAQYTQEKQEQAYYGDVEYTDLQFASAAPNWAAFLASAPK